MKDSAIVVFTARGKDCLIADGGSGSWVLNEKRASACKYLVCVQNRGPADYHNDDWGNVSAPHKNAFFVGKISDVVLAPDWDGERPKRWLIRVDEYAEIAYENMWDGARNPVAYTSLKGLGIDEEKLQFNKMPYVEVVSPKITENKNSDTEGITIRQAKILLSKKYDVPQESIEIIIRA
ncbi:hypothetical protein GCM10009414_19900 [Tatumella terrea]|uniref:hypothetical protein n=1 Tax=Tatumella terrea TaxID=419007 RepID=UPI0031D2F89C